MNSWQQRTDGLYVEDVPVRQIAEQYGTPCFVYSRAAIEANYRGYTDALSSIPHRVCYAVKANDNLAILQLMARLGAGFDIVSGGELQRVLRAGGAARDVVFSGVGKSRAELATALAAGIGSFNVESTGEIDLLNAIAAQQDRPASVALRINPDVNPQTHPYISTGLASNKFGIPLREAHEVCARIAAASHLQLDGIACHIGSQITTTEPFAEAFASVFAFVAEQRRRGHQIKRADLGGGLGVHYDDESPPTPGDYAETIVAALRQSPLAGADDLEIAIEPGRSIVGPAGVALAEVLYLKRQGERHFAVLDIGMNDLLRPALYQAYHRVLLAQPATADATDDTFDLVGPICETGDFIGHARQLALNPGSLLAIADAGAYCTVMGSNYNARGKPPEVLVDGGEWHLIRARQTIEDQFRLERLLPD